jgi:four helix bundle protein
LAGAREFVKSIYELTSLNNFCKDFGLKDQIQRAAVSIMIIFQKDMSVIITENS